MKPAPPWVTVLVLWAAGLCAAAQFAKVGLFLPELAERYPNQGALLGWLISSVSLVGALLGLSAGAVAVRLGLRRLLLAGLALAAMVSLLQSSSLPAGWMLVSRIVEGLAHLAIVVSAPTLIALFSPERHRPAALTLWGSFFGVSFALTAWMGLPLVATHGLERLFFMHAALCGLAGALVWLLVPASDSGKVSGGGPSVDVERGLFSPGRLLRMHTSAWSSPFIAAPAAGWLCYTFTFVALLSLLPGLAAPGIRSAVAALLPIASIVTSLILGTWLLRSMSAVQVICLGFVLAGFLSLTLPIMPSQPVFSILLFASLGLIQGASFASVAQLNSSNGSRALANGAMAQAGNIGNLCGTPVLLFVMISGGMTALLLAVLACYGAGCIAHVLMARRRQSSQAA